MLSGDDWARMSQEDWKELARNWLLESTGQNQHTGAAERVIMMNFTASPELQWQFILIAISMAESEAELQVIGGGPIEHLLGWHGSGFMHLVEAQAANDPKFSRSLKFVRKYRMEDDLWLKLQALQHKENSPVFEQVLSE